MAVPAASNAGFVGIAAFVVILGGCSGPSGQKYSARTADDLHEFRTKAVRLASLIEKTNGHLGAIVAEKNSNALSHYQAFVKMLASTEKLAENTEQAALEMTSTSRSYFRIWERELAEISDPDMRRRTENRRIALMTDYGRVDGALSKYRAAIAKLLTDWRDLARFLSIDLSPTSIETVTDVVSRADNHGSVVRNSIEELAREIDGVCNSLRVPSSKATAAR
jgi:hypothetical protein